LKNEILVSVDIAMTSSRRTSSNKLTAHFRLYEFHVKENVIPNAALVSVRIENAEHNRRQPIYYPKVLQNSKYLRMAIKITINELKNRLHLKKLN
jgi:hypothetical protein